jgi:hypothetical protein
MHQLLHLCDVVTDLGPLYLHSCFSFESLNGTLRKFVKGTQHVESQIVRAVCVLQRLPSLINEHVKDGTPENNFLDQMHSCSLNLFPVEDDCFAVGCIKSATNEQVHTLRDVLGFEVEGKNIEVFSRLLKGKTLFHSKLYGAPKKRNRQKSCVNSLLFKGH